MTPDLDAARAMLEGPDVVWMLSRAKIEADFLGAIASANKNVLLKVPGTSGMIRAEELVVREIWPSIIAAIAASRELVPALIAEVEALRDRVKTLERMDQEAANHVESVICMRTHFTGEPPYVGWEGLGLALREALDDRDAGRATIAALEARVEALTEALRNIDALDPERHIEACGYDALRGLVLRMGEIARAALSQKDTPDAR